MLEALPKAAFSALASSQFLKRVASRYGMRRPGSFARRFIAGETTAEAIAAAKAVEARGMTITLDHLGESLTSLAMADAATREYLDIITSVVDSGIGRNISLKLTQLGLDVDRASCVDNMRRVLDKAEDETRRAAELASSPVQLALARKQAQDIRMLKHSCVRNVHWTKPLTVPALVLTFGIVAIFVVMLWK